MKPLIILLTVLCCMSALALETANDLTKLCARERKARMNARKLLAGAHAALDRGEYDKAIDLHKQGAALRTEADGLVEQVLKTMAPKLASDEFEVREEATRALFKLSSGAIPKLEQLMAAAGPEEKLRLEQAIATLKESDEDADGLLHQWASDATASSEFTDTNWSAKQATGKPNTFAAGDCQSAWASSAEDAGDEWLELTYTRPVRPKMVRVYETFNPGAVSCIEAKDDKGNWHELWRGADTTAAAPGWLEAKAKDDMPLTRAIKITLESGRVAGWNEIDAVELIGEAE